MSRFSWLPENDLVWEGGRIQLHCDGLARGQFGGVDEAVWKENESQDCSSCGSINCSHSKFINLLY